MEKTSGFHEIEHTADWQLEVWAPDLPGLFEQAARGMLSLMGAQIAPGERVEREIQLYASDAETLLVGFLEELLYLLESEDLAFDAFDIQTDGKLLNARLAGGGVEEMSKEIKAVTFHNLAIERSEEGLRVRVVFDV
jgi:SHS2 domain-containing protein